MNRSVKYNQPYQQENNQQQNQNNKGYNQMYNQQEYEPKPDEYEPEYIPPYEYENGYANANGDEEQQARPGYVYDPRYGWIYIYGNQGVDYDNQNHANDYGYGYDYGNSNMVVANTNNINSLAVGKVGTIKSNRPEKNDKTERIDKNNKKIKNPVHLERTSSNIPSISNTNKTIGNNDHDHVSKIVSSSKVVSNQMVRKGDKEYTPKFESSWFETENGVSLENYLKKLLTLARDHLACNVESNSTRGILVPHAGIRYSGLCAASSYYELTNRSKKIKHIILLCTNHQPFDLSRGVNIIGCTYSKIQSFRNSGSNGLQIDMKTMEKLKSYINIDDRMFENEHSFFNQIPFIEMVAGDALITPLLIGNMALDGSNGKKVSEVMGILMDLMRKESTVVICTSDLSHVNGNFEMKMNSNIFQNIRKHDNDILQFLYNQIEGVKYRTKKIDDILFMKNSSSCGIMAIYLFGKLLNSLNTVASSNYLESSSSSSGDSISKSDRENGGGSGSSGGSRSSGGSSSGGGSKNRNIYPRVSCYYTSLMREHIKVNNFNEKQMMKILDIPNNTISSVSYCGMVFTTQPYIQTRKQRKIEMLCTQYEKIASLALAREQLYYTLSQKPMPSALIAPINSPLFKLDLGVFVTLYMDGKLRGCIGTLETGDDEMTLGGNIRKYVEEAALNDSRFDPVILSEFPKLEYSVTVLNEKRGLTLNEYFGNTFVLGRDGIYLKKGGKSGYFLPSVAVNNGYDKKALLEELCLNKVGSSSKECFRKSNVELYYNEGIEFRFSS